MNERLLLFFPGRERGGCEEYALAIGKEAKRRGFTTEVCFPDVDGTRGLLTEFRHAQIAVHRWRAGENAARAEWGSFNEQRTEARALIDKLRPNKIWMALPWVDSAVGFLAACGEKGLTGICSWQLATEEVRIPPAEIAAAKISLKRGLRWMATSNDNRSFVARSFRVRKESIRVVHNGLLAADTCLRPCDRLRARHRTEVRNELGIPEEIRLVISVARLCLEQKAQDLYLEAITRLGKLDSTKFIWVGVGEDRQRIEKLVADADLQERVLLLGYRADVIRLLMASDLFVLPSKVEGMPFCIFEALACGCPVVATNVGGIPEILNNGHDSILVNPNDADALAHAVKRALRGGAERRRLSENGYSTAERHCSRVMLEEMFAQLEN